jgi:hypothetical protein
MSNKLAILGILFASIGMALPQVSVAADQAAKKQVTAQELAKAPIDATFEAEGKQVRLLVGGGGSKGILKYQGKEYPFSSKAVTLGGVGVTEVHAVGEVRFLKRVEDFAGTYSGIGAGATLVKGKGSSSFENEKGVIIIVKSKSDGLALSLGVSSITVTLDKK